MQRLKASIQRRASKRAPSPLPLNNDLTPDEPTAPEDDTPQGNVVRGVRLFCESGGPNSEEEEVLHLPVIVEAAESSPLAAKEAALLIRKFLSKENNARPHVQYNAIMLIRILADNPGPTFTRSLDSKFAGTVKDLLRTSQDPSVQQILRETLETFASEKSLDEGLKVILEMWLKEKNRQRQTLTQAPHPQDDELRRHMGFGSDPPPRPIDPHGQQNYFARNHRVRGLPSPTELASRIEEARTSAKLLSQVVQSTPSSEILNNEFIAEFAHRCQSASRSIQGYINSDNPTPDDDTLLTLIETNEQLSTAMSKHQRAVLTARKVIASRSGAGGSYQMTPSPGASGNGNGGGATENPFGDENRSGFPSGPLFDGTNHSNSPTPPVNGGGATPQHTTSTSLFGPPSQPTDRANPNDESFRLTLPNQPPESTADPRWSWSQRMSTQTGYGPGGGGGGFAGPDSRMGSMRVPQPPPEPQMQQGMPPPNFQQRGPPTPQNPQSVFQRQESAIEHTTMRGGAAPTDPQAALAVPGPKPQGLTPGGTGEDVSPVSPLESRQHGGMGRL